MAYSMNNGVKSLSNIVKVIIKHVHVVKSHLLFFPILSINFLLSYYILYNEATNVSHLLLHFYMRSVGISVCCNFITYVHLF